jgi:DNA polymerase-3 subunit alpha
LIKKIKEEVNVGMPVTVACIIDDIRIVTTKRNDQMAFIKISDFSGTTEAVVFSKLYITSREVLIKDNIVAIQAKVTERNGEKSLMIESLKKI